MRCTMETGEASFWIRPHRTASSEDIYLLKKNNLDWTKWKVQSNIKTKGQQIRKKYGWCYNYAIIYYHNTTPHSQPKEEIIHPLSQ